MEEKMMNRKKFLSLLLTLALLASLCVSALPVLADEECYIDEHLGFIKFGSRVDVYLPMDSDICVKMGQKTTGNQTIIAKLK